MANNTAWVAGNINSDLNWHALITSSEMLSLAGASGGSCTLLANAISINNGTGLDQFMDISAQLTMSASNAVLAGANIAIWLAMLQQDGSTYGDGNLTPGIASTLTPPWPPIAVIPLVASTRSTLQGQVNGIILPPGAFKAIIQNNSGFALHASTAQNLAYRTYNQQLNH